MKIIDPERIAEQISRDLPLSIPEQVANLIEMWTVSGTIKAGDRLPSVRDLGEALGVSHKTARRVLDAMKARGLVYIEGNRTLCAGISPQERRDARKKYEAVALSGILALRETGCSMEKARAMVERAWSLERGPYAAV